MRIFLKVLKFSTLSMLAGGLAGLAIIIVSYILIAPTLPDVESLRDVQLQVPLRIYTQEGELMQVYGEKRRRPVALNAMPDCVKNAFLAAEDARFYEHPGVDYQGILRAVWHLVRTGGDRGPGGSTITQQLARDFGFVSRRKLFTRKLKEIFLALKIERELTKDEIFELYLNKIYLGNRAYGVAAAAQGYYGKSLDALELPQCAMLASLPKAPSRINPINNPPRALERRNYALRRMMELDFIDQAAYESAVAAEDFAFPHEPEVEVSAHYAAEAVRGEVVEMLGEDAYTGGYRVFTTISGRLQSTANRAVRRGLMEYDQRHGFRGAEDHFELQAETTPEQWDQILDRFIPFGPLEPALIIETGDSFALAYLADGQTVELGLDTMEWARTFETTNRRGPKPEAVTDVLVPGDVVRVARGDDGLWSLSQLPDVEGALVSLKPEDGSVLAMVGGFDYFHSKFNRATQAKRQPGSSFKPFVYSAALSDKFTTATLVNDAPVVFSDSGLEKAWRPENYEQQFFGPTRLREGMVHSRNLISIRVLRSTGVEYVWEYVQKFGFSGDEIPRDLSMALGSGAVYPVTMARAYSTIANGGFLIDPHLIERIEDGQGNVVFEANPPIACRDCEDSVDETPFVGESPVQESPEKRAPRVMDPATNYLIRSLLSDVIKRGTGKKALELGRGDLGGKTGTTNDQRDAWFSGFNDAVVTTTWVGFDTPEPLGRGEVGGRAALPVWIEYMREALAGVPETSIEPPENVVFARIDPETGRLANASTPGSILEVFRADRLPPAGDANETTDEAEDNDPYDIF